MAAWAAHHVMEDEIMEEAESKSVIWYNYIATAEAFLLPGVTIYT